MAPPQISSSKLKPWKETPAIEPEEGERRAVEDTNDVPPDDDVPVDGGRNSGEVPPDSFVDIDDIPPDSRVDIDEIPSDSHVDIESEEEHEEADGSREGVRPLEVRRK